MDWLIRRAEQGDAEAIRTIYNVEVLDSTVTMDLVARSLAEQQAWLNDHGGAHPVIVAYGPDRAVGSGSGSGFAVGTGSDPAVGSGSGLGPGSDSGPVVDPGVVVGFASLSPWRARPAYRGTVENSVYVARTAQGRGVGRVLLESILRLGAEHGFHTCMARIAGGNEASIKLHEACGFELLGVERQVGRKFNRWIDVTVMQRML